MELIVAVCKAGQEGSVYLDRSDVILNGQLLFIGLEPASADGQGVGAVGQVGKADRLRSRGTLLGVGGKGCRFFIDQFLSAVDGDVEVDIPGRGSGPTGGKLRHRRCPPAPPPVPLPPSD